MNASNDGPISEMAVALLLYSEWLDVCGLMKSPRRSKDNRTHEELVAAFVKTGAAERLAHHS